MEEVKNSKNFIETFVEEDIGPGGQYEGMQVHTRFPPEPNGYLHNQKYKYVCRTADPFQTALLHSISRSSEYAVRCLLAYIRVRHDRK